MGLCPTMAPSTPFVQRPSFDCRINQLPARKNWPCAWNELEDAQRREVLAAAHASHADTAVVETDGQPAARLEEGDDIAAASLEDVLKDLEDLEFVPLSLREWRDQRTAYLDSDKSAETLLLFDRDFRNEGLGENEGLREISALQANDIGFCGLVSHTVSLGQEYTAWQTISAEHGLDPDKFVVVAKDRLKSSPPDYHGFLGMLRLAALKGRYTRVKKKAWEIFEHSVDEAKAAMARLSVFDFDRIVFTSSRDESVWEPDTILRVFGVLMRRAASLSLHGDEELVEEIATTRRVSDSPERVVKALNEESRSNEVLEMQRFEIYDDGDALNPFRVPIDCGDIFRIGTDDRMYMLLAQPCDLVVRKKGTRNYETNGLLRMAPVAELVRGVDRKRDNWGELPFFEETSGKPAFVNFGKVHQVPLAVLDLCVVSGHGSAAMDFDEPAPDALIEPWRVRNKKLRRVFKRTLDAHVELIEKGVDEDTAVLAFPGSTNTLALGPAATANRLQYDVVRAGRLRRPWAGALLTEFTQYQARAAFEHDFGRRHEVVLEPDGDKGPATDQELAGPGSGRWHGQLSTDRERAGDAGGTPETARARRLFRQ